MLSIVSTIIVVSIAAFGLVSFGSIAYEIMKGAF